MGYLLGIDVGTQSLKVVLLDAGLRVMAEASASYGFETPAPQHAEQDVRCWQRALPVALAQACQRASIQPRAIVGVGLTGQLDGCVAVDRAGEALGPCLIWMDRRASLPATLPSDFRARTGQIADPGHMAAKIAWLRAHGGLGDSAACFHQPVSFMVEWLTGARALDPCLASTTMLYHLANGRYDGRLLEAFGIDAAWLPRIRPATEVVGQVSAAAAASTGLMAGTPVVVGSGDDFVTPLGGGAMRPGRAVCVVGTAEVVGAPCAALVLDAADLVETHPFFEGGYWVENPGWLAGGAVSWLANLLGSTPVELDDAAAATSPGAEGVTFLPALTGAMSPRWHAGARGAFYGMTPATERRQLARALLEGIAFAASDVLARLGQLCGGLDEVLLLGGGAKSRVWAQLRADITGLPHAVAYACDAAPLGAAMLAGVGVGVFPSLAAAGQRLPPPVAVFAPNPEHAQALAEAKARYDRLFVALAPLFDGAET